MEWLNLANIAETIALTVSLPPRFNLQAGHDHADGAGVVVS